MKGDSQKERRKTRRQKADRKKANRSSLVSYELRRHPECNKEDRKKGDR